MPRQRLAKMATALGIGADDFVRQAQELPPDLLAVPIPRDEVEALLVTLRRLHTAQGRRLVAVLAGMYDTMLPPPGELH